MAVIPVAAAVEITGAALGHHRDLRAGVAAVLGLIHAGQDLELSHGIQADGDVLAAIGAGIDIADTVDRELIFSAPAAVDLKPAQSAHAADREVGGIDDTWNQFREIQRIAAVDLDVFHLLRRDRGRTLDALRLKQCCLADTSTDSVTAPTCRTMSPSASLSFASSGILGRCSFLKPWASTEIV